MDTHYLLGIVSRAEAADLPFAGHLVTYTLPRPGAANDPFIGFYALKLRGDGGSTDAATWLRMNAESWRTGWIERTCAAANCAWLWPIMLRLAAKEDVPLEEIQGAYAAHNGGENMPHGTLNELRELVSRRNTK